MQRAESVVEDLKHANEELQSVINIKSDFINSLNSKNSHIETIQRLALYIARQNKDSIINDSTTHIVKQVLDKDIMELLDLSERKVVKLQRTIQELRTELLELYRDQLEKNQEVAICFEVIDTFIKILEQGSENDYKFGKLGNQN